MKTAVHIHKLVKAICLDLCLDPIDRQYVLQRSNSEGITFLTVTLPKLVKCVLLGLELGSFTKARNQFEGSGYTHIAWKGGSLRFFRSLLSRIFGKDQRPLTGEDPAKAILTLRQLGEYLYKLCIEFTDTQLEQAEESYFEKESTSLREAEDSLDHGWAERLRKSFETYYSELSAATVHRVLADSRPRATKGAFAGSTELPDATAFKQSASKCPKSFASISGYFKPYPSGPAPILVDTDTSDCVEVLFVPKDSRGPRVISKEPLYKLSLQMSFFDFSTKVLQKISRGRINFTDQGINQSLAREGSISGKWVTADMKEASDSVLLKLVRIISRNSPAFRWFLRHTRTPLALLPKSKRLIRLRKLSGMGSGLTFPTMALVIHLSVCTLVSDRFNLPFEKVMRSVYVYGDDLIVPKEWWDVAREALKLSQLEVNTSKSYSQSHFRESCGADYYCGYPVGPVRMRIPSGVTTPGSKSILISGTRGIVQLERHCRELVKASLYNTADYLYHCLQKAIGILPSVYGDSPVLGKYTPDGIEDTVGYVPLPNIRKTNGMCPYKYLGKVLASANGVLDLFSISPAPRYGEIVSPYDVKIAVRYVSGHQCLGLTTQIL